MGLTIIIFILLILRMMTIPIIIILLKMTLISLIILMITVMMMIILLMITVLMMIILQMITVLMMMIILPMITVLMMIILLMITVLMMILVSGILPNWSRVHCPVLQDVLRKKHQKQTYFMSFPQLGFYIYYSAQDPCHEHFSKSYCFFNKRRILQLFSSIFNLFLD